MIITRWLATVVVFHHNWLGYITDCDVLFVSKATKVECLAVPNVYKCEEWYYDTERPAYNWWPLLKDKTTPEQEALGKPEVRSPG